MKASELQADKYKLSLWRCSQTCRYRHLSFFVRDRCRYEGRDAARKGEMPRLEINENC